MCIYRELPYEQQRTLQAIFTEPPPDIPWSSAIALLKALQYVEVVKEMKDRICTKVLDPHNPKQPPRVFLFTRFRGEKFVSPCELVNLQELLHTLEIDDREG